ncbi:MAG: hypothetical protein AB1451_02830 [Nitrospirota bacterium]
MKTIVVVTADPKIARALSELVGSVLREVCDGPARVLCGCSAEDIRYILQDQPIDLLMIDYLLADIRSLDVARWLGSGLDRTAKIILTNNGQVAAEPWNYIGSEISEVLSRPLGRESLKQALRRYLTKN